MGEAEALYKSWLVGGGGTNAGFVIYGDVHDSESYSLPPNRNGDVVPPDQIKNV